MYSHQKKERKNGINEQKKENIRMTHRVNQIRAELDMVTNAYISDK